VTDALAAGSRVGSVPIADAVNVIATYPIAVLSQRGDRSVASAFVEHVFGDDGQRILADHGFLPPS
jgi:molybdate transport system substrate-binding protein